MSAEQLRCAAEHEAHIKHLGECMVAAHMVYTATGCLDAKGAANWHRIAMERAIAQRSPLAVARMEAERGLS